jgi:hypothetical protein
VENVKSRCCLCCVGSINLIGVAAGVRIWTSSID